MKWKVDFKKKDNWIMFAFVVLGLIAFLTSGKSSSSDEVKTEEPTTAADTYIPAGHTLVPLEIANAEAIESIMSASGGVVDLYLAQTETQKGGLKVGSKLKMIRAPLNPEKFAVLIKETEGQRILKFSGPFIAVIHNPKIQGSKLADTETKAGIRIHYQN